MSEDEEHGLLADCFREFREATVERKASSLWTLSLPS